MASPTVSTRFLVISDTHNFQFETSNSPDYRLRHPLPKVDVLLHYSDLTWRGGVSFYEKALKMLGTIGAELRLVIAGNHNLNLDKEWWDTVHNNLEGHLKAVETMTGPLAAEANVTYLQEGTYTFTLMNGARFTVYASPYSPELNSWAFTYKRTKDRYNEADKVASGVTSIAKNPIQEFPSVDIVMTHGPPKGILDQCPEHAGCENLLRALRTARPRIHCFGHIHEAGGAKVVDWESEEGTMSQQEEKELADPPYESEIPTRFRSRYIFQ